ncbi:MAG: hypothetical protein DHS20C10_06430 [marine bacterium B5-7]|nr:MAG: hypothetical protein DHS20C10_06430 [marine bacterium B5-7]
MPVSTIKMLLSASEADFSRPNFLNQFTLDTWNEALPSGLTPLHLLARRGEEKGRAKILQCLEAADVSSRMQVQRSFEQIFLPTVTDQECPVAMESVCLDDGMIYGASDENDQAYFGYFQNGQVLSNLLSTDEEQRCPSSRLPIKWAVYLRDLPEEIRCTLIEVPGNNAASLKPINDKAAFRVMYGDETESFYRRLTAYGRSNSLLVYEEEMNEYQLEKGVDLSRYEGSAPLTFFMAEDLVRLLPLLYGEDFSRGAEQGLIRAMNARLPEAAGSTANLSAWYFLSERAAGVAVIAQLLGAPWFMAALAADEGLRQAFITAMNARRPEAAGDEANQSAWYCLSSTPEGVAVIGQLLGAPWFMAALAADEGARQAFITTMNARLPEAAGTEANQSAWYLLSLTPEGVAVIAQLLGAPWFMAALATDEGLRQAFIMTMNARRPDAAGAKANLGAWFLLSLKTEGVAVIGQLLGAPWFMAALAADEGLRQAFIMTMNARLPGAAGARANFSAWYLLSQKLEGVEVIAQLLSTPWFMATLAADEGLRKAFITTMNARLPDAAGAGANLSAWYLLSLRAEGIAVIGQLLGAPWFMAILAADEGLRQAFITTMNARGPEAGAGANFSAWLLLSNTAAGVGVIARLLATPWFMAALAADEGLRKAFITTMNARLPKAFTRMKVRRLQASAQANLSAWYLLSETDGGVAVIAQLLGAPWFMATLAADEGLRQAFIATMNARGPEASVQANQSAWYLLSQKPEGVAVIGQLLGSPWFMAILAADEGLRQAFITTMNAREPEASVQANQSAWYCLSSTPEGVAVIGQLLGAPWFMAILATDEGLRQAFIATMNARGPEAGARANFSAWLLLSNTAAGVAVIAQLLGSPWFMAILAADEGLRQAFITTMNARGPEAGARANFSAWLLLSNTAAGVGVIAQLLSTPWFMATLAADEGLREAFVTTMTARLPEASVCWTNVSAWYLLSETDGGVAVIAQLLATPWFMATLAADEGLRQAFITTMNARLPEASVCWANVSAWYLLSERDGGVAVIAQLLSTPWFMATLAADEGLREAFVTTMTARRPAEADAWANESAWFLLSRTVDGTAVIAQLLGAPWFLETLQAGDTLLQDFIATLLQLFQSELFIDVAKDNAALQEALMPLSVTIHRKLRALEDSDATAYHRAMVGLSQLTLLYAKVSPAAQANNVSFFGDGRKRSADTAGGSEEGNEPNKRSRAGRGSSPSPT